MKKIIMVISMVMAFTESFSAFTVQEYVDDFGDGMGEYMAWDRRDNQVLTTRVDSETISLYAGGTGLSNYYSGEWIEVVMKGDDNVNRELEMWFDGTYATMWIDQPSGKYSEIIELFKKSSTVKVALRNNRGNKTIIDNIDCLGFTNSYEKVIKTKVN